MLAYQRIGLTVKSDFPGKDEAVKRVVQLLKRSGAEISLDPKRCGHVAVSKEFPTYRREADLDLLVVIGGDGTILRTIRELEDFSIPILSVNRGAVGFLAETDMQEAEALLPKLLGGSGVIEERSVLCVHAKRGDEDLFKGCVLNEAVIAQGSISRLIDLRTLVNGEELTTFRADGLIIATPTGSTAYSLSAGGPIVHPRLSASILTPINPYSFSQKPIVVPGDHAIEVEVLKEENKFKDIEVSLTLDGQTYVSLERHDRIYAYINAKTVKFLRRSQDTFFQTLRRKLKWGE